MWIMDDTLMNEPGHVILKLITLVGSEGSNEPPLCTVSSEFSLLAYKYEDERPDLKIDDQT